MPKILSVLETPVYVDDLKLAKGFYADILGLRPMIESNRICAFDVAPGQVLIAFLRGVCEADAQVNGACVPGHGMQGKGHFAFRIEGDTLGAWIAHLEHHKIGIDSRVVWPGGGESLYFSDPFGNVVELGTAGIWPNDRQ